VKPNAAADAAKTAASNATTEHTRKNRVKPRRQG
jgi:hypothetical protein